MKIWPDEALEQETYFRLVRELEELLLVETDRRGKRISTGAILEIKKGGIELCSGYKGYLPTDEDGKVKII